MEALAPRPPSDENRPNGGGGGAAELLREVAFALGGELDRDRLVDRVTEVGTRLTRAAYGAFFYDVEDERGGSYRLYSLSGAPRAAFEGLRFPRGSALFAPRFDGASAVRVGDVRRDPRYAAAGGMPPGAPRVRSYLAVPVVSRTGRVHGGLFFGHPDADVFDEEAETVASSIAAIAAVAIDNAELYREAQREIARRAAAEEQLRRSQEEYEALVKALPAAVYTCDAEGRVTLFNDAAVELWGRTPEIGKDLWCGSWRIYDTKGTPVPLDACPMALALRDGEDVGSAEIVVERPDGTRRNVLVHPRTSRDASGRVVGGTNTLIDITARSRIEKELQESRAMLAAHAGRLEELDQRKDTFLAILGHELRNPLNAIAAATKVLKLRQDGRGEDDWVVDTLGEQVGRAVELINDLLDFSRIAGGRVRLRKKTVELESLVGRAVDSVRPYVEARRHTLEVRVPARVHMHLDPTRTEQVIVNLLSNAARYTKEQGRIELEAFVVGGVHLHLSVRDDGVGIPPDQLAMLWEPFSQVGFSSGGLGIGLSLCKQLVELHGGAISAESAGAGRGACFTVELPDVVVPGPPAAVERASGEAAPSGARRVLLVEDQRDAARALSILLAAWGCEVEVANDGAEAVDLARSFAPDLVLLDIALPDMSGHEVLGRLKAQGVAAKVVAVTGFGDATTRRTAEAAGFDGFLLKPIDAEALSTYL